LAYRTIAVFIITTNTFTTYTAFVATIAYHTGTIFIKTAYTWSVFAIRVGTSTASCTKFFITIFFGAEMTHAFPAIDRCVVTFIAVGFTFETAYTYTYTIPTIIRSIIAFVSSFTFGTTYTKIYLRFFAETFSSRIILTETPAFLAVFIIYTFIIRTKTSTNRWCWRIDTWNGSAITR